MSAYERPINWNTSGKSKKDERIAELESMLATMNEASEESMRWHKDQNDKIKRLRDALQQVWDCEEPDACPDCKLLAREVLKEV